MEGYFIKKLENYVRFHKIVNNHDQHKHALVCFYEENSRARMCAKLMLGRTLQIHAHD